MFLIKRPFFPGTRLEGAFNAMAKPTKKKSSAKKPAARKARTGTQETRQTAGIEKGRKADESRENVGPPKKKRLSLRPVLLGLNHREEKTRSLHPPAEEKLLQLRDAMVDSMAGVAQDTLRSRAEGSEASAFGMHQADAGSDAYDRDFALSLLSQEQDALYEIDQALKRIELGTYGKCEMSGKPIPHARLEAIPFARFTVECQSQLEKQNKASRVRQSVTSLFGLTEEEGGEAEEEEATPAEVKE